MPWLHTWLMCLHHLSTRLERQLACVAEHDGLNRGLLVLVVRLNLLQDAEDEHCCLPHPRLGLAQDVHAQNGLRDALMLHCASSTQYVNRCSAQAPQTWRSAPGFTARKTGGLSRKGGGGCSSQALLCPAVDHGQLCNNTKWRQCPGKLGRSNGNSKLQQMHVSSRSSAAAAPARAQAWSAPSDGCSKPQSTMARISSGFSRKSLKPEL